MQYFPKNLFCTIRNLIEMPTRLISSQSTRVGTWRMVHALMFRTIAHIVVPVGVVGPVGTLMTPSSSLRRVEVRQLEFGIAETKCIM